MNQMTTLMAIGHWRHGQGMSTLHQNQNQLFNYGHSYLTVSYDVIKNAMCIDYTICIALLVHEP